MGLKAHDGNPIFVNEQGRIGPAEWAASGRALPGESVSGDHFVALDTGDGAALFGVIDGLGHGDAAADAAHRAAAVLSENPAEPLDVLILLCHRALSNTRGAAMTLVGFSPGLISWIGIGNVRASLVAVAPGGPSVRASVLMSGGIVGYSLPPVFEPQVLPVRTGDLLVMATDGIAADEALSINLASQTREISEQLVQERSKSTDDSLVLVVRHRGAPQ
jgi:negative regulator of sigma-B (phosphoserine phosphatase)